MSLFRIACRFLSHSTFLIVLLTHAIPATFGTQPFLAAFKIPWLESLRTMSLDVSKAHMYSSLGNQSLAMNPPAPLMRNGSLISAGNLSSYSGLDSLHISGTMVFPPLPFDRTIGLLTRTITAIAYYVFAERLD